MSQKSDRTIATWFISIVAIVFGLLTLKSGGAVLFIDGSDRLAAGNYVPFVVWFNFLAGFIYLVTGVGFWLQKRWAVQLSIYIALATLFVFVALGIAILLGQAYEVRTIVAMSFRTVVWSTIAAIAYRRLA